MTQHVDYNQDLHVLIIEDNLGDFVLIEDFLYELFPKARIKHLTSFESFNQFIKTEDIQIDVVLLDLNLPDIASIHLVQNVLTLSHQAPVIILTGYADIDLAKKSLELGVYDFLLKDEINPALLNKSIQFALSRSNYVRHIENQNEKLKQIAWTQSHVLRAPLSRMLGIINVIQDVQNQNLDLPFWIEQLRTSTLEMDEIVKRIVMDTHDLNKTPE